MPHSFTMGPIYIIVLLAMAGTSLAAQLPYIIEGDEVADIKYWPWQGSVHKRFGGFVCGCSLISREWAVTAASCVQSPPYDVRFGSLHRNQGTVELVKEIIVHEDYSVNGTYRYNDIAVLKFSPLELSDTINTVKLGVTDEVGNDQCHITGWGVRNKSYTFRLMSDYTGYYDIDFSILNPKIQASEIEYPEFLHQGDVDIMPNYVCDDYGEWPFIDETHVCTQWPAHGSAGTCWGDTGSPLVCYKDDKYELVGISSWQRYDCSYYYYSVFTRVSQFRLWINDHTGV